MKQNKPSPSIMRRLFTNTAIVVTIGCLIGSRDYPSLSIEQRDAMKHQVLLFIEKGESAEFKISGFTLGNCYRAFSADEMLARKEYIFDRIDAGEFVGMYDPNSIRVATRQKTGPFKAAAYKL